MHQLRIKGCPPFFSKEWAVIIIYFMSSTLNSIVSLLDTQSHHYIVNCDLTNEGTH